MDPLAGSRRIDTGSDLLGAYADVVLNPVKAGLSGDPADWRWSSFATTIGVSRDFPFVDAAVVLNEVGAPAELSVEAVRELAAHYRPPSGLDLSGI